MKPGIYIQKGWFDDDVLVFRVDISDGISFFSNQVYVGYANLTNVISDLDVFKNHIHGGLLNIQFGEFGLEYAKGAFHARFHFNNRGKLYVTCKQQSDFREFSIKTVANEATIHLKTEPALLDNFVVELKALNNGNREDAYLKAMP